jgi:hypothetical protein
METSLKPKRVTQQRRIKPIGFHKPCVASETLLRFMKRTKESVVTRHDVVQYLMNYITFYNLRSSDGMMKDDSDSDKTITLSDETKSLLYFKSSSVDDITIEDVIKHVLLNHTM